MENSLIRKDDEGRVRQIVLAGNSNKTKSRAKHSDLESAARAYIAEHFDLAHVADGRKSKYAAELELSDKKELRDTLVLEFKQTAAGLPLFGAGVALMVDSKSGNVLSASNHYDYDFEGLKVSLSQLSKEAKALTSKKLGSLINLPANLKRAKLVADQFDVKGSPSLTIDKISPCICQYRKSERQHEHAAGDSPDRDLVQRLLHLSLPEVPDSIEEGKYYAVNEVLFTGTLGKITMTWRAMIEPKTDTVLSITPMVDLQTGYVYLQDPVTTSGDDTVRPSDPTAALNQHRAAKPFATDPPAPAGVDLKGDFIEITELLPPNIAPPSSATGRWDYDANSDDFSAVNAYYHCDMVFRLVQDMGFNMNDYFDGTPFPVKVDHRGCCGCVNAAAWSNGAGLDRFTYGLVQGGQPVGMATDLRIVFHEFGHAILFDHVNSGSFGFAHSAGDSMAAIYADPCSKAPDRFLTFPWITLSNPTFIRRHDRTVQEGWAWYGVHDDDNYGSEQILSTTLFRAYRALGGDHPELCERQFASRYMLYLNFFATGMLTPVTNPSTPEEFATTLMAADLSTNQFEGQPGGLTHKIVRWAFEKQGAYIAAGTPNWVEGRPPAIDTFIDDGRKGEYEFTMDWCETKAIWNRREADGAGEHQPPVPGTSNHLYVVVQNRGEQVSPGGKVSAFHLEDKVEACCCGDCGELEWPRDFDSIVTPSLEHGEIQPGSYEVVGPFTWIPREDDCVLISVDTKGDLSNTVQLNPGVNVPLKHLVPFDNNLAVRCMCSGERK